MSPHVSVCVLLMTLVTWVSATGGGVGVGNVPPHFQSPHQTLPASPQAPVQAPAPLTTPHGSLPQAQPWPQTTIQLPVYVPVEQITDKIITNISIYLPTIPPAQVHVTQPTSPQPQHASHPIPVVGPTLALPPSSPTPPAAPVVSTQAPPPRPQHTLLEKIHSIPELGILSLHLSLPLFENITRGILNQTSNPEGVAPRITFFGPSNIGVLRFWRKFMAAKQTFLELRGEKCDPHEWEQLHYMKSAYHQLTEFSESFNKNAHGSGRDGNLQQQEAHRNMLQTFMPTYHEMFNKANFTEEEQSFLRANLLYHIANSSIHLPSIPHLSFPSTLLNDSRFVLLNSVSHPTPVEPQRLELMKREEWPGQAAIELRFGVPGSFGYYKSRVYEEPWLHNILASNGILHVIDRIQLFPQNISTTLWMGDLVSALKVLNSTGLLPRVDVTPNITMFVPSEEAFAFFFPYHHIKHNQTLLQKLIAHHIVAGVHYTTDFRDFSTPPLLTYNNDTIIPRRYGVNSYLIEDAQIIVPNILFKNGVIHIIDKVLVNPQFLGQSPQQLVSPHYPSQPFPLIPPFQTRPNSRTPSNITCGPNDSVCHIVNVVTNQTSPYPTCYNPSTHVCVNNSFLCPHSAPNACGVQCYDPNKYQCETVFADGALHYFLAQRTTPYTPTPSQPKPAQPPTPSCPQGDQICNIIDIRVSLTEAKPQCFNPYTHICSNKTFLCPVSHPFVCGFSCYHSTFYTCSYGFYNNSFQWMLTPTPLLTQLEANKGQPTTPPMPTPATPAPTLTQPHQPQPQPQQPPRPTPHPAPHHPTPRPTAAPTSAPVPTPTPTHRPTAQPTTVTCPSQDQVCQVTSPFLPPPAHPIPTCYDPRTHVCANATFLCPVSSPLLCDKHCYNATVFSCVGNTLKLRSPTIQPRLSPQVAARVAPRPLSPATTTMTHLPSRVDLTTTIPTTTVGSVTLTQSTNPSPIWVELPSGQSNVPGTTVSRTVSLPAGARVALIGTAEVSTVMEALMNLPPETRQRLGLVLSQTAPAPVALQPH